ncbi:MAG: hypothetical protein QF473_07475 [Planctomycetota bacterium]|jgi:hypothetical protein|nr:hypothetical protein [Planctomycetota bacterium]
MAHDSKERRGYASFSAIHPDEGTWDILVSKERAMFMAKMFGESGVKETTQTVPNSLADPLAIFEGMRRPVKDEDEDAWLCYVARPKARYWQGNTLQTSSERVFLVHVNEDRIAYNWRWEKTDPNDSDLPVDYENRFAKRRK